MMKYYQEITLIPDAEIPPDFLWTKVYAQIHLAFADRENIDHKQIYGVSFPEYADESMGEKARVFAPEEADLKKLDLKKALRRLSDYVHITSIREVPDTSRTAPLPEKPVDMQKGILKLPRKQLSRC